MTHSPRLGGVFGPDFWRNASDIEKTVMLLVLSYATTEESVSNGHVVPAGSMVTTYREMTEVTGLTEGQLRHAIKKLVLRGCIVKSGEGVLILTPFGEGTSPRISLPSEESNTTQGVLKECGVPSLATAQPPVGGLEDTNSQEIQEQENNKNLDLIKPSLSPSQTLTPKPRKRYAPAKGPNLKTKKTREPNIVDHLLEIRAGEYPTDKYTQADDKYRKMIGGSCKAIMANGATEELILSSYRLYLSNKSQRLVKSRHPWEFFYRDFGRYVEAQIPAAPEAMELAEKLQEVLGRSAPEFLTGDTSAMVNQWARDFETYLKTSNKPHTELVFR